MKTIIVSLGLLLGAVSFGMAADTTPVFTMWGKGGPYVVTHATLTVSSNVDSAIIYEGSGGYREFYFHDGLSATNTYYYRMDGTTTSVHSVGMVFATPYTLESSNQVTILAPVGVADRVLRVRIREK